MGKFIFRTNPRPPDERHIHQARPGGTGPSPAPSTCAQHLRPAPGRPAQDAASTKPTPRTRPTQRRPRRPGGPATATAPTPGRARLHIAEIGSRVHRYGFRCRQRTAPAEEVSHDTEWRPYAAANRQDTHSRVDRRGNRAGLRGGPGNRRISTCPSQSAAASGSRRAGLCSSPHRERAGSDGGQLRERTWLLRFIGQRAVP